MVFIVIWTNDQDREFISLKIYLELINKTNGVINVIIKQMTILNIMKKNAFYHCLKFNIYNFLS